MKLTSISCIHGDCTMEYGVDTESKTVGEFVDEVLRENPNEWGYISIDGTFVANRNRCEYRYGKIVSDFPDETVKSRKISYVESNGGWSNMDYAVYTE